MHPAQIKETINLAYQMIRRHHLVEIKRIKELSFSALPPTHHARLPLKSVSNRRNHGSRVVSTRDLQHNPPESRHSQARSICPLCARVGFEPTTFSYEFRGAFDLPELFVCTSSCDRNSLYFYHNRRISKTGYRNRSACRKVITENLRADLRHSGRVAGIDHEHCHCHHVFQRAVCFCQGLFDVPKRLAALGIEIAGEGFSIIVLRAGVPCDPN